MSTNAIAPIPRKPKKTFRKKKARDGFERISSVLAEDLAQFLYTCGQKFLIERRNASDAFECYSRALCVRPQHPGSLHNVGVLLAQVGDYEQAAEAFWEEMKVDQEVPRKNAEACSAFVECARRCGRIHDASLALERIREEEPYTYNLQKAVLANEVGDLKEAERCINLCLETNPGDSQSRLNKALIRMTYGDWADWFKEYEHFLSYGDHNTRMKEFKGRTPWDGSSSLEGKTLLVVSDQGNGDAFQFVRFFPRIKERAHPDRIIFYCQRAVEGMCRTAPGVDGTIAFGDVEKIHDHYDEFTSMLGILSILRIDPHTCSARGSYLRPDERLANEWEAKLTIADGGNPRQPRIGLVWRGDHKHGNDHNRSMPLKKMLEGVPPGFTRYSLQFGKGRQEADEFPDVTDLMSHVRDFSDTAALISALDAVVTVDTAIAHLAGAMGKTCVILLPKPPEWRWLLSGEMTPWYPSVTLARQDQAKDWMSAVRKLEAILRPMER